MKQKIPETEEAINKKINDAVMKERKHMNDRQKIEIEKIKRQYEKEINVNKIFKNIYIFY